ncbi:SUN domain-containing protein 3-like isoform 1-T1 [Spheniscus humboldti]
MRNGPCMCLCSLPFPFFFPQEILQLTQAALKKVLENYLRMPDWALEAIGATIDAERTSKSYDGGQGKMTWWLSLFGFSSANPPETILQPRIAPGSCWAFQGSRGHVVIRLPEQIWPTAFTVWHISEAVSPSGEVSSAPKEFAVSVSLCLVPLGGSRPQGKAVPETCFSRRLLSDPCLGLAAAEHRIPWGGHWGHVGVLCLWGLLLCFMAKDPGARAESTLTQSQPKLC